MKLQAMVRLALLILLLSMPGLAVAGQGDHVKIDPPKPLSEFSLTDHMGASFTKDKLTGK